MEIKASIIYDKKVDTPKYDVTGTSLFLDCFEVEIITNGSETFEELISNKEAITEAINRYNESGFTDELGEDEQITDLSFLDTLKDNITYIRIDASDEEYNDYIGCLEWNREIPFEEKQELVDEYLQFHPEYKNYTLLINDRVDTSTDMEEIREKYKDYKDILLNPKDSEVLISMKEAKNAKIIDTFINDVKSLNLTPLESALLVYDFVREKPYLLEDEEQSYKVSRNIYNTVDADNDKIVCAGYARLYEKIMNALGIKTNLVILHKNNGELVGHERVMIRIDDDYYDVHGLFSIDPTRDSRDKDDNTKWLYNYRGFMKNLMETKQWDDKNHYDNISVPFLTDHTIDDIDYIRESLKFDMPELMRQCMNSMTKFRKCSEDTLKARKFVNYILSLYDLDLDDIEGNKALFNIFDENYDIIKEEFNAELSTSTFIQALMKVRYIESKLDPNKFTYDANELFRNIPRYNFKENNEQHILNLSNPQQIISNVLFGENKNVKPANEEEKKELLAKGYAYLCSKENSKIKAGEKVGLFKINKSINLYYNNKNINKK